MDEFFDWEDDLDPCQDDTYFDVHSLTDDQDLSNQEQKDHMRFLNNQDYSLNSPLIKDKLDSLRNFEKMNQDHQKKIPKHIREAYEVFSKDPLSRDSFMNHNDFQQTVHKLFQTRNQDTSLWTDFIQMVNQDARETFPVVKSFVKGWLNKQLSWKDHNISVKYESFHIWGEIFFEAHLLTLLINSKTSNEFERVKELITEKTNKPFNDLPLLGRFAISGEFLYFPKFSLLLDREHLLMIKDTMIARCNTLLSLHNRSMDFPLNMVSYMQNLYNKGDAIFVKKGNKGYNTIKLLEPYVTWKMSVIAEAIHPLFPKDQDFETFICESIRNLNCSDSNIFFKEVDKLKSAESLLVVYGSFRHWGHPQIDYLEGLRKLNHQVNLPKHVDQDYAEALASDLAYLIIDKMFKEKHIWVVDKSQISPDHILYHFINDNTWPTTSTIHTFGDNWHRLPLVKCFDIPDMILPSLIYSDKSHSMNRKDVFEHISKRTPGPIPAKRVLETYLKTPATNWKKFLETIDKEGLDDDDLIIGLRGKEREIKIIGRFFALMSWKLREYFVITEYLIKEHYVPLFSGLTMADDLTRVIKKMLDSSQGQGQMGYKNICIANHIDYEKWNNHQRYESTAPVFKVMGQFLGLPRIFERTHLFFQKSVVYYNGRPDLMDVRNGLLINKDQKNIVCWNGQLGGLEGLRQKGWSVLNLLVINREAKSRNTEVKTLAQGDNQVICTQYETQLSRHDQEQNEALQLISQNNKAIMSFIKKGTEKLGLMINQAETLISTDLLIYGKVPIFRGSITSLTEKRWSRITCMTNNQLPTIANIMATASTNALTVANFSYSPIPAMVFYNFAGNMVRLLNELHNPALRTSAAKYTELTQFLGDTRYKMMMLYLDPSLGGLSGLSLGRFMIRGFPDPITEGLACWKLISSHTDDVNVKDVSKIAGNPDVTPFLLKDFDVLLENPMGLNIPRNVSVNAMIRREIKRNVLNSIQLIKNKPISDCLKNYTEDSDRVNHFLRSIKPIFPRFLSEFRDSTFVGIGDNLLGLFENSKTIRRTYQKKMSLDLDEKVRTSELTSLMMVGRSIKRLGLMADWSCSSNRADFLRTKSWGERVVGTTIPHPIELLERGRNTDSSSCTLCSKSINNYLTVTLPKGMSKYRDIRGPYPPYLGSRTKESTSILQPWEKETKVPLFKKADNLRRSIGWFIKSDSRLAKSIGSNLLSLSGENWEYDSGEYSRTGSALHRFACSRQQAGGYCPISPAKFTWMIGTTDTLCDFKSENYDFMYQSLLIYTQLTSGETHDMKDCSYIDHYHVKCQECVRTIGEVWLDSSLEFKPRKMWDVIKTWVPEGITLTEKLKKTTISRCHWDSYNNELRSHHVGLMQGFLYGETVKRGGLPFSDSDIFPQVLITKLNPPHHLRGLLLGLLLSGGLLSLGQSRVYRGDSLLYILQSNFWKLMRQLRNSSNFTQYLRSKRYLFELCSVPHRIPPSYPISKKDMLCYCENYFNGKLRLIIKSGYRSIKSELSYLVVFADTYVADVINPLTVAQIILPKFFDTGRSSRVISQLREFNSYLSSLKNNLEFSLSSDLIPQESKIALVNREVRHSMIDQLSLPDLDIYSTEFLWGMEVVFATSSINLTEEQTEEEITINLFQNPSISGMRLFQFSTGAHYKLRSIIYNKSISYVDFLCVGDGSGGLTSYLLRDSGQSRGIFNSLLDYEGVNLAGGHPEPPPAITALGSNSVRCVNLDDCWENFSDLSDRRTWTYFKFLASKYKLYINLIVLDFENRDKNTVRKIEKLLFEEGLNILQEGGTIVYKSYGTDLRNYKESVLPNLFSHFKSVQMCNSLITSSQSSEFYYVATDFFREPKGKKLWIPGMPALKTLLYSEHSEESEFDRCVKIFKRVNHMFDGVPRQFLPDTESDLYTLLTELYLSNLTAVKICTYYSASLTKEVNFVTSVCLLLINNLVNITTDHDKEQNPPNDHSVLLIGSVICAYRLWLGIVSKDITLWKTGLRMIQWHFPFSCGFRFSRRRSKYRLFWSLEGNGRIKKYLHLDSKMALIGRLMRVFHNFKIKESSKLDLSTLYSNLIPYNRGLTLDRINRDSGFFNYPIWSEDLVRTSLYPTIFDKDCWES